MVHAADLNVFGDHEPAADSVSASPRIPASWRSIRSGTLFQGAASSLKQLLLGGTVLDYGLACWTLNASARPHDITMHAWQLMANADPRPWPCGHMFPTDRSSRL